GLNGFALPEKYLEKFGPLTAQLKLWGVDFQAMHYFEGSNEMIYIALALLIVWLAPNVQQMMDLCAPYLNILGKGKKLPAPRAWLTWRPSLRWAIVLILCAMASVLSLSRASEFLYFQF
ncbi:MAG TPA: hypothetical protein PLP16_10135, partial [Smithellaceae bacterium]|nr:hypothetical protein [Smithellaceae bacterium]